MDVLSMSKSPVFDDVRMVSLDNIKILPFFSACPPRPETIERKRAVWISEGSYGGPLVIDSDGWLLDGYASYLVMRDNGEHAAMARIRRDPRAILLAGPPGKRYAPYSVSMGVARRAGPHSRVVLWADGQIKFLEARNLEFNDFRAASDAKGIVLPGWRS